MWGLGDVSPGSDHHPGQLGASENAAFGGSFHSRSGLKTLDVALVLFIGI
jgi:hypothetical protein